MAHNKHKKLQKPTGGKYGRNELGIIGAPCDEIKILSALLLDSLKTKYAISYIDADHDATEQESWSALKHGAKAEFIDKISFKRTEELDGEPDFYHTDLTLINANHFKVEAQIAFVHPKKDLRKKQNKLSNVVLIILEDTIKQVPDFLVAHINDANVPIVKSSEVEKITQFIDVWICDRRPKLYGLVLAGGKSTRMNEDKALLNYHGKPQQEHTFEMLETVCDQVFVSSRDEQQSEELSYNSISDKFIGLGPYGGILSVFMEEPNVAWLVVAIDLPFLDLATINKLVACRNPSKLATTFIDPSNEFPEPLITIWEPKAYPQMLKFLAKGYSCPRKLLINSDVELITERTAHALTNVNTPEELDSALKIINE